MRTLRVAVLLIVGLLFAAVGSPAFGDESKAGEKSDEEGLARLDFRKVVKRAKAKVFPAVVFIRAIRETTERGKKTSQQVSGSGVLITAGGEFLTNWHVVDKAVSLRCLLFDGTHYEASIIGTDKDLDLALARLERPEDAEPLPHAVIGSSGELTEGDFVMAMGAPWGLTRSVSIGIVSCTRRYLPNSSLYNLWLQTDAAISPGNSGGPLVDTDGEVIGINTRGMTRGGDMGFAIPSDVIRRVLPLMREHEGIPWSWTGLQLQPLRDFNRDIYFEGDEGVVVSGTEPESPARRVGFQPKDRILEVNGVATNALSEEDLPAVRRTLGLLPRKKAATFTVLREGERLSLELTPRQKGKVEGEELELPRWDFSVKEINQFDNPDLYFYRKKGVYVYGIKRPGNASRANLSRGDILLEVDGKSVETLDDVEAIHTASLENIREEHRLVLTILRQGLRRQVVLDISRDYEKE